MLDVPKLETQRRKERLVEDDQISRLNAEIVRLERQVDGIRENSIRRDEEEFEARERRYAQQEHREEMRYLRRAITGCKRAKDARGNPRFVAWHYVHERWRKRGKPSSGVEIPLAAIIRHVNKYADKDPRSKKASYSERWVRQLLAECELYGVLEISKHGRLPRTYLPIMPAPDS